MPFELLETQTKDNMPPMASLSYLRHVRKGKEMDRGKIKPRLTVTLPTKICISKQKKFAIYVGTGTDRGKVRVCGLKPGVPGGVKGTDFKSHVIIRFGHVPKLGDEIFDGIKCPIVRIDDDTYEIAVPDGLLEIEASNVSTLKKTG
jgi:hypothetical protein